VTGLERAIAKNKGLEFGSLLHQLAADYIASPHSANVKKTLTAINPQAVVPKRAGRREAAEKAVEARPGDGKPEAKVRPKGGDHKPEEKAKVEPAAKKKAVEKPAARPAEKIPAKADKPGKKAAAGKKPVPPAALAKTKSPTKQLAKRKPR